jgi:DNA polymerase III subunit chi
VTEIVFYSGVAEPHVFATRLTIKLFEEGRRVRIVTPDASTTDVMDRLLWTHVQGSFVPHCRVDHESSHPGEAQHADVLINLSETTPDFIARFQRVADIVGNEEPAVKAGRARFKRYKADGYALTHHDMTGK